MSPDNECRGCGERRARWLALAAAGLLALGGLGGGCGQKIEIPEAQGLFGVNKYVPDTTFTTPGATQVAVINGLVYLLNADGSLTKRDQNFVVTDSVTGLADPTALCANSRGDAVLVWEQGARRLSAFATRDLAALGQAELPEVQRATAMAVCATGVEEAPGAWTFLYLSDPDSGVVHRCAVFTEEFDEIRPWGILTRSEGIGARSVHVPAGLAVDHSGRILVCDADTLRNWVVRFNPTPDLADTVRGTAPDPLRGLAVSFGPALCNPPSAADCTLGDAAECNQSDWEGGPSDELGAFHAPRGVVVDGLGRIFVTDTGNHRCQVFTSMGADPFAFGSQDVLPGPVSLGLIDMRTGAGEDQIIYGAILFVLNPGQQVVERFLSYEWYSHLTPWQPPPQ